MKPDREWLGRVVCVSTVTGALLTLPFAAADYFARLSCRSERVAFLSNRRAPQSHQEIPEISSAIHNHPPLRRRQCHPSLVFATFVPVCGRFAASRVSFRCSFFFVVFAGWVCF